MDLGGKIKAARLEMGLSQRQLCGEFMTRNMLSMLENGAAKPSMETLRYLAGVLRKPMGYFLEEADELAAAREAFALENWDALRQALDGANPTEERALLEFYYHLHQGAAALAQEKLPYACTLLQKALELRGIYITKPLRQRARVLLTLAGVLRTPMGYFLEEADELAAAREAFALEDWEALHRALTGVNPTEEGTLLEFYDHLHQGAAALAQEKLPYACTLLQKALELRGIYITKPLRQRARVLLTLAGGKGNPDNEDTALLALAMEASEPRRQAEILGAAEDRENPRWAWAMAQAKMALGEYAAALELLEKCPDSREVWQAREVCCREVGDFKGAYEAACKLR